MQTVTFEEWVEYSFRQGRADFYDPHLSEDARRRYERYTELNSQLVTEYLTLMFENARDLADEYSSEDLADGTWFVFGLASDYFTARVRDTIVPRKLQERCYRAVVRMYTDLYDRRCTPASRSLTDTTNSDELDMAVYMIWDMSGIELACAAGEKQRHLVDASFEVLAKILGECNAPACLKSGLHGAYSVSPNFKDRSAKLVEHFLSRRRQAVPAWLSQYADEVLRLLLCSDR